MEMGSGALTNRCPTRLLAHQAAWGKHRWIPCPLRTYMCLALSRRPAGTWLRNSTRTLFELLPPSRANKLTRRSRVSFLRLGRFLVSSLLSHSR